MTNYMGDREDLVNIAKCTCLTQHPDDPTPCPVCDDVAWEREGTPAEPCVRGTVGCSMKHAVDTDCEVW
jgi:hypothetical protein